MRVCKQGGILDIAMHVAATSSQRRPTLVRRRPRRARRRRRRRRPKAARADARATNGKGDGFGPPVYSGLRQRYHDEVVPALQRDFSYANPMEIPRLEKVIVNIGLGEAIANAKALDAAVGDLATITGQKPIVTRAKRSIAQFRLRTGMPIGAKVTLRGRGCTTSWSARRGWPCRASATSGASPRARSTGAAISAWAARAARLPGDRLRQDRPPARDGDQHRDDRQDRRGGAQAAAAPRHAVPGQLGETKSTWLRSHRSPGRRARPASRSSSTTAARSAGGRGATCVASRCAASASGSAPWRACCRESQSRAGSSASSAAHGRSHQRKAPLTRGA